MSGLPRPTDLGWLRDGAWRAAQAGVGLTLGLPAALLRAMALLQRPEQAGRDAGEATAALLAAAELIAAQAEDVRSALRRIEAVLDDTEVVAVARRLHVELLPALDALRTATNRLDRAADPLLDRLPRAPAGPPAAPGTPAAAPAARGAAGPPATPGTSTRHPAPRVPRVPPVPPVPRLPGATGPEATG